MMQERSQRIPNLVVLILASIGLAIGLVLGGCTATPLPLPMNELGPAGDAGLSFDAPQSKQDAAGADMGAYPDAPAPMMDTLADLTTGDAEAGTDGTTDAKGEGGLSDLSAAETTTGD